MQEDFQVQGELHKAKLKEIGKVIQESLPASMGFTLLLFDYTVNGDHGSTFYLSTVTRKEGIELLEEFIKNQKQYG